MVARNQLTVIQRPDLDSMLFTSSGKQATAYLGSVLRYVANLESLVRKLPNLVDEDEFPVEWSVEEIQSYQQLRGLV